MTRISSRVRLLSGLLAGLILIESCASSTVIQSNLSGAKVYLNSAYVGNTPYTHTDTKIVGATTYLRLEKEGYQSLNTAFARNEQADIGAIIGGVFLLVPFLWTMKYNPDRMYELAPATGVDLSTTAPAVMPLANDQLSTPKAVRLRDLKKLLDDGILTKDEYEKEKKKVLDSDN